jgi:protein-L-isoaspartate(D-aspartate) O-methyltransferase
MTDATRLRRELLASVRARGGARTESIAEALLSVPRHAFVPDVPVEAAYRDAAIVTKRDADGLPVSSSSQPTIMALMLDQLGPSPGQRVLEIGAGTGFNAALLAHLVGPSGFVASVDIDPDVVERARVGLALAGYPEVEVICADGAHGHPAAAPYDRIIATVGVWDLAPAWLAQLTPGGRIVAPLDLRGVQVSVAFEWEDGHWVSRSLVPCGFMRLRGALAGPEQIRVLDPDTGLVAAVADGRVVDGDGIRTALSGPSEVRPSGVRLPDDATCGDLGLWLALAEPRSCVLSDEDRGSPVLAQALLRSRGYRATPGLLKGVSIAALGRRPVDAASFELDAHGYGPDGGRLAGDLAAHVRAWHAVGRPGTDRLSITACPRGVAHQHGGIVIEKVHTRLVVSGL